MVHDDHLCDIDEVSAADGRKMLDNAARRHLNMSREEFLNAWDSGLVPDPDSLAVQHVAALIPFGR